MEKPEESNPFCSYFDQVRDGVYVATLDGHRLLYANAPAERMFGKQEIGKTACYQVMRGLDAPCADCFARGDGKSLPLLDRTFEGKNFHMERIRLDWNGIPALAVRCEDVAEPSAMDQRKKRAFNQVETLLNSKPGTAFRCKFSPDWDVMYANDGFYDFRKDTREEFASLGNKMSAVIYAEDQAPLEPLIEKPGGCAALSGSGHERPPGKACRAGAVVSCAFNIRAETGGVNS